MYDVTKQVDFKTLLINELAYNMKNGIKNGVMPNAIGEIDFQVYEQVLPLDKVEEMTKIHIESIIEGVRQHEFEINPPMIFKVTRLEHLKLL
jgi:hypothetical protein